MHPLEAFAINSWSRLKTWSNHAKGRAHIDELFITSFLEGMSYLYMSGAQLWLTIVIHDTAKKIDQETAQLPFEVLYWSFACLLLSMQLEAATLEKKGYSASLAPTLSYIGSGKAKTAAGIGQIANFGKSLAPYALYSAGTALTGNGERFNWLEAAAAIGYIQGSWYIFWNGLIYHDMDKFIKEFEDKIVAKLGNPD
ncbi:MAG: hypothetical protein WDZ94_01240 [Patescibacteria group bacterium]